MGCIHMSVGPVEVEEGTGFPGAGAGVTRSLSCVLGMHLGPLRTTSTGS